MRRKRAIRFIPVPNPAEIQEANKQPEPAKKSEVTGLCPVCSSPLLLEEVGEYYKCSDHYLILKDSYISAWDVYDSAMTKAKTPEEQSEAGVILIGKLLDTNVAENKPLVKLFINSGE